jgi:chemotaxis protein methyltransferase CheR
MDFLQSRDGAAELGLLISALTTNVSHFYREKHHFRTLEDGLLPKLIAGARAGQRVRLWSAGCATGQEPYSMAIAILRRFPDAASHDVRILATDIDERALAAALRGHYTPAQLEGVPPAERRTYFIQAEDGMEVGPEARALVRFRALNLNATWPFRGPFDAIFCRNVVIYFDTETQAALWPRFHHVLGPDGVLFIGHSERLDPASASRFASIGVTTYRKTSEAGGGSQQWH